jgi:hypothetical protein
VAQTPGHGHAISEISNFVKRGARSAALIVPNLNAFEAVHFATRHNYDLPVQQKDSFMHDK